MTRLPSGSDAALAPLRESLLAAARATASESRRAAEAQARAILDDAEREAARIRAAAADAGEATARSEASLRSARVRRQAHEAVLARRNALRLEVWCQVREAAVALRTDPRHPDLLARLRVRALEALGPDATVTECPEGGIIAESGSRRLDLSLPTLANGVLESMTPEISALWAPP